MPRLAQLWAQCGPTPTTPAIARHQKAVFAALHLDTGAEVAAEMTMAEFRQAVADLDQLLAESLRMNASPRATAAALSIRANVARNRAQQRDHQPQQVGTYEPAAVWAQIRSTNT